MPSISKAKLRRRRQKFPVDKGLLNVVLLATAIIVLAMIVVPFTLDDGIATEAINLNAISLPNDSDQKNSGRKSEAPPSPAVDSPVAKPSESVATATSNNKAKSDQLQSIQSTTKPESKPIIYSKDSPAKVNTTYHTVFSTGCSLFQDWQSYVFFYHLLHSGQEGPVTRIASGCSEEAAETLKKIFENEIAAMAPDRFRLHLTPDFSNLRKGKRFKYYNKPCGMQHWMQNELGYPNNHEEHDETIFILLDPDQILLRPFTNDFTHSSEKWRLKEGRYKLHVEHGSPFAQQYGYGLQWKRKVTPEKVFLGETPVTNMTDKEAMDYYYGMGPPYVATGKDMYTIVDTWATIVPRVHVEYPHLLAEMFAYNLAAAHHGIRHTIAHSFQVSDVYAGGEGWKLINAVPASDVCHSFPKSEYPHVIHYCQRYFVGKWFIGKYKLRKDFISCGAPLLTTPPADLALIYNSSITPDKKARNLSPKQVKQEAFMVCAMKEALNEAAIYYKDHHCDKESANYNYNYTFHQDMKMPDERLV